MSGKQHSTALLPPRADSEPNMPRHLRLSMNRSGLGALSDLVHQGKIRYFGHSTFPVILFV